MLRFARNDGAGADAIVVLGCRLKAGGLPTGALRRRVALGVHLYNAGMAPLLVLSGGGAAETSEAEAMRRLALAAGVPEHALACEAASRDTVENALRSARLLWERDLCRVVLVSHRTHLPRARLLFRLAGLRVVGSAGVPAPSLATAAALACYEIIALPRSIAAIIARGIRNRPAACGR